MTDGEPLRPILGMRGLSWTDSRGDRYWAIPR